MHPKRRRSLTLAFAFAVLPAAAHAQARGTDPAGAEKLFTDARKLLEAGKYAEACQKLADSQKLDPGVGTLLNLAQCYEKLGRTATAWATYHEALAAARASGQVEREKRASRAADALESHLPKLTVTVPDAAADKGVEVKRNGTTVPKGLWGVSEPVDPGEYLIEARAPGKKPWSTRVKAEPGRATAVILPPLDEPIVAPPDAPPAAAPSAAPDAVAADAVTSLDGHSSGLGGQRIAALVVGGAGVIAAGVGAVFVFSANSTYDSSSAYCNADNFCTAPGLDRRESAFQKARIATAALVGGGLAFAGGAALWLTAPSRHTESAFAPRLRLSAGALPGQGAASFAVTGIW